MTIGSASHLTRRSLLATATMSAFGLAIPPAFAQARLDEGSIAATAQNLQPGQFLWAHEAAPEGPVIIVVSLSKQRADVYRNGVLIGIPTISSGTAGHETPTGIITLLQKKVDQKPNLYDDTHRPTMHSLPWR